MPDAPEDDKPGITIPRTVFWALLISIPTAIFWGSWFMSGQTSTISGLTQNQAALSIRISALETRVDTNKDATATQLAPINDRLTRMEAQLTYLFQAAGGHK